MNKPAKYWKKLKNNSVQCNLCMFNCIIKEGKAGICRVRKNINGELYLTVYNQIAGLNIDPIEKKPLFHFHPGENILSIALPGCNLSCPYCQNKETVSGRHIYKELSPLDLVSIAIKYGSKGIAYTYTEPIVWFEYMIDTMKQARKHGLYNVVVTNGEINTEPLDELLTLTDAMNIDLKSIEPQFYKKIVKGSLEHVKQTIELAFKKHVSIETTLLLIPEYNDKEEEIHELSRFLSKISKKIPLHISRFFPYHGFASYPTPIETLKKAYSIAKEYLYYVFLGNVSLKGFENTYCPECGNLLVERNGYHINITGIKNGTCDSCRRNVDIILN